MRKHFSFAIIISVFVFLLACNKDEDKTNRVELLTGNLWMSDSLLLNGFDASGPGQMLENFKGQARFNEDGTGTFGNYQGTWRFAQNETELVIQSDSLPLPLSTKIHELNSESLKVSTSFPNLADLANPLQIRLTFKAQ